MDRPQSLRDMMREARSEASAMHTNWLEDVLAGLLINGVRQDEIEIQHHPHDNRTVVVVRGVQKYERFLACMVKD